MNIPISQAVVSVLKTIIVWGVILAICVMIPINCHVKLGGKETSRGTFEFDIGKKENSIKIGNTNDY